MGSNIKTIVIGGVVLLGMVGTLVYLLNSEPPSTEQSEATSSYDALSEVVKIYEYSPYSLLELEITNDSGTFKIEYVEEDTWGIVELSDYKLSNELMIKSTGAVGYLSATKIVEENATDLAQYGLAEPYITYTATFEDASHTIEVGSKTPDNAYRYGKVAGDNTVYIFAVNTFIELEVSKLDYIDKVIVEGLKSDGTQQIIPQLHYFEVNRPDLEKPIILTEFEGSDRRLSATPQAPIFLQSPAFSLLNENSLQKSVYGNFGIVADNVMETNITPEMLTEYGFDTPTAEFTMTYDGDNTVTLTTGEYFEENDVPFYYLIKDGVDQIFKIKAVSLPFMKLQANDIVSSIVALPSVIELEDINIEVNGKTATIGVIQPTGEDAGKAAATQMIVNGETLEDSSNAKTFISLLLTTSAQGITENRPTTEPKLTVNYNYLDGETDVLSVYIEEDMTCIIELNGQDYFTGRQGFVQKIETELENLLKGEPIDEVW